MKLFVTQWYKTDGHFLDTIQGQCANFSGNF
jgi:hypothetical protein